MLFVWNKSASFAMVTIGRWAVFKRYDDASTDLVCEGACCMDKIWSHLPVNISL